MVVTLCVQLAQYRGTRIVSISQVSIKCLGIDMIYDMMDYINVRPKADEKPA